MSELPGWEFAVAQAFVLFMVFAGIFVAIGFALAKCT